MRSIVRATGIAVAGFVALTGAAFTGTSLAGESDAAPITTDYRDHAVALTASADFDLNPVDAAAPAGEFAAPVVQHAVATVDTASGLFPQPNNGLTVEEQAPAIVRPLSALVEEHASSDVDDEELECLATAVYYESKGEPLVGQLAVAEVIVNRTKSSRFPSTLCGVVKQRGQFSFVRGGRLPHAPRNASWRKAVAIAHIAVNDLADGAAPSALFFHARRVSPGWKLKRIAAVGNHVFYR